MQRRVRQHHAQAGIARRDLLGDAARPRACAAARSAGAATAAARARRRRPRQSARRRPASAHHDGERLLVAVLAAAQLGDGRRIARVAGEVIAAQSLQRADLAAAQAPRRSRRAGRRSSIGLPGASRSWSRGPQAGQAVGWAWKRRSAGSSYSARQAGHIGERGHRRARRGRRGAGDDRQPRAAVGAVEERIAVTAVGGVEQLGEAIVAGGHVGRDEDGAGRVASLASMRNCVRRAAPVAPRKAVRSGPAAAARSASRSGTVQRGRIALDLDQDVPVWLLHEAAKVEARGQVVHEGPKADPLDDAADHDRSAFHDGAPPLPFTAPRSSGCVAAGSPRTPPREHARRGADGADATRAQGAGHAQTILRPQPCNRP